MAEKHNEIIKMVKRIIGVLKKSDYHVKKTYLYGSYAKGKYHKDSDIDILIVSDDFTGNRFRDGLKLMRICQEIDSRIEFMPYRSSDFKDSDPLVVEVKATGKEIKT
jgi:predicted nucleotidyltransferase